MKQEGDSHDGEDVDVIVGEQSIGRDRICVIIAIIIYDGSGL